MTVLLPGAAPAAHGLKDNAGMAPRFFDGGENDSRRRPDIGADTSSNTVVVQTTTSRGADDG